MNSNRPIDVLDKAKGKRILVKLKNGEEITGDLVALDLHLNMWLENAEIVKEQTKTKIGNIFLRGDTIVYSIVL
ncbi:MAG: LSM domain-containing protein [Candidatus Aenigmarchaeota archaeon]|nr:small nuclear ribonucleoprotein [Candidatus Aenigmarchaeota archaeon]MDW8149739.1 LSM domain-containing protein [Candidatus Aenigmarchaeota archaeon]